MILFQTSLYMIITSYQFEKKNEKEFSKKTKYQRLKYDVNSHFSLIIKGGVFNIQSKITLKF